MISIIINNYNYGHFLRDAIDSALQQSNADVETIVVDDGSTDNSKEIINEYGEKIIPVLKENGGQGSGFNAGFVVSKGDVIIFLDADDYLGPEAAYKAARPFSDPKVVKVHWPLWQVDSQNNPTGKTVPAGRLAQGDLRENVIKYGPSKCGGPPSSPPTSGNAWSRKFLQQVLPMPEAPFKYGADDYLFVLTPLFGEIRSIPEPLGYYRVHGANDTLKPDYLTTFFTRYEHCCNILSQFLLKQGIAKDSSSWPRDHWYHQIYNDMNEIANVVPPNDSFILVDENHWLTGEKFLGRRRILFTKKNGQYWGPPKNDDAAIDELEEDRRLGATYIVFTWPAFWWLDHYKGFHDHLHSRYDCVLQNERMIIYQLNGAAQ